MRTPTEIRDAGDALIEAAENALRGYGRVVPVDVRAELWARIVMLKALLATSHLTAMDIALEDLEHGCRVLADAMLDDVRRRR